MRTSVERYDVVVVGAGPYGLSTAAHLLGRGLKVAVYGKPLELWRHRMPEGMLLRSHWWATNLSDPENAYGFERFFSTSKYDKCYPIPRQAFIDYGLWFQKRAVPNLDETYVALIERRDNQFLLTLQDGRQVASAAVVLAIGVGYYAHRPEEFGHVPSALLSHSSEADDFNRFSGKRVIVVGGGQSAIEYAALLHEAGAGVHVVARRPIAWRERDRASERTLAERLVAPNASIAPGWENWILDHAPYVFYRFPQPAKDSYNSDYMSGASDWLRNRVIGKVALHEAQTVRRMEAVKDTVQATISDGETLTADHVMLATGYRVNLNRLTMIHPSLLSQIQTDNAIPLLNHWFESSVPSLYFVGLTSLRAFGPLYRFVAGCGAASRRVARAVARKSIRRSYAVQSLRVSAPVPQ